MKPEIRNHLEKLLEGYESWSFEDLSAIGWQDLDKTTIGEEELTPSVWSEVASSNQILLVVQLLQNNILSNHLYA